MTVIEKQYMDAVIAMNRKMADQNKTDWERYRMDVARDVSTYCTGLYLSQPVEERPTYEEIAEVAVKMADALITKLKERQPPF